MRVSTTASVSKTLTKVVGLVAAAADAPNEALLHTASLRRHAEDLMQQADGYVRNLSEGHGHADVKEDYMIASVAQ
jgi:hypothetical protein